MKPAQAYREGGVSYPGPCNVLWALAIAEKYKVHQKAPFSKEKFKNFLPRAAPQKCLGPHGNDSLGPTVAVDGPCEDKADSAAAAAAM